MHDRYLNALLASIDARIDRLERFQSGPLSYDERALIRRLNTFMEKIMATLQETLDRVLASGDRLDSLIEYNKGIKAQLDAVLAGVLTPEQQAQVDAIFKEADENVVKTDEALNTNVPPPVVP